MTHAAIALLGLQLPMSILFKGLVTGMIYGLLAVGMVLVFRTTRVINFAHGEIGAFGAVFMGLIVNGNGVPYWLAFPIAVVASAGVGAVVELGVVRRLRQAPRLMTVVATLGFAEFLISVESLMNVGSHAGSLFPQPAGLPSLTIGGIFFSPAYTGMLILSPIVVAILVAFLRLTRHGKAMRAAADNRDAARLSGVFASRMSTLAWAIAGGVSAVTAILLLPTFAVAGPDVFGPGLLLRSLAAAVLGRMSKMPTAMAAGLGLGLAESVLRFNTNDEGVIDLLIFAVLLGGLLLQRRLGGRSEEMGSWAAVQALHPLPAQWRRVWAVRHMGMLALLPAALLVAVLPLVVSFKATLEITDIFIFVIVGLGVGVVTGLCGQVSFGQFAIAGVGAWIGYVVATRTGNYVAAALCGGFAGAFASIIVGIPALRIRGLMLAVTTLAFAIMAQNWLLPQPWAMGRGVSAGAPLIAGVSFENSRRFYYLTLGVLVGSLVLVANIRRSGLGRIFVALRDNEDAARGFTIAATQRKLQAFAIAGFLAGLAGALEVFAVSSANSALFTPSFSIAIVAMTVVGGIGTLFGPLLGAIYIFGIPDFLPIDSAGLAASSLGWLLLILYFPGGLTSLAVGARDRLARRLVRLAGHDPDTATTEQYPSVPEPAMNAAAGLKVEMLRETPAVSGSRLLEISDLRKKFGGLRAVDGVSFSVAGGEILGLIGPNGAGKTTLFELISGFQRPDSGLIRFEGHVASRGIDLGIRQLQVGRGPAARARWGLIRSFQDSSLFPTLTVMETIMLAFERSAPTQLLASIAGSLEQDRAKRAGAEELITAMGLGSFARNPIQALSTGTRRIVELACMVALRPRLLLLDEPSSGIAQRETEQLGEVLLRIKRQLQVTMVVIEHDIPLVMGLSDRIIAMESGRIIASGPPEAVRADPAVVEAYLGGDLVAIQRSGAPRPRQVEAMA